MNHDTQDLSGSVALISGAASGIGLATAKVFLERGTRVLLTDARSVELDQLIAGSTDHARFTTLDVTSPDQWRAALAMAEDAFGGLDVLINCAGLTGIDAPQDPEAITPETWRRVHAVNVDGAMLGCQAALPLLRRSPAAAIVNVSSFAARLALPGAVAYAASKAALCSYSRSLALHCAEKGYPVRVNCVLPGAIRTPLWNDCLGDGPDRDERERGIAAGVPMGRFGEPEEVAASIAFLASPEASFITGAELLIDGGQSLKS